MFTPLLDVKPAAVEVVKSVLSRHMDDLEPRLVRHGCDARAVAELIGAKPGEVRLLQGRLETGRARKMACRCDPSHALWAGADDLAPVSILQGLSLT